MTAKYTGTVPSSLNDDFEQSRRIRETKNEIVVSWIYTILLAAVFVNAFFNEYIFRWIPFPTPPGILVWSAGGVMLLLLLLFHLQRTKHYQPSRKYIFLTIQTIIAIVAIALYGAAVLTTMVYYSVTASCIATVVIAGLRYSTRLVIFANLLTGVIYLLLGIYYPGEVIIPRFFLVAYSLFMIIISSVVVAYNVASLIRLHQESVWKERLQRFLAPELVQALTRRPEILAQQTEHKVASVVFTDIRGFTALSERLSPEEVVQFLNLYLEEMTNAIMEHQGMVDKYIGDAVMGVFGVPLPNEHHAKLAVQAALSMKMRLAKLNESLAQQNLPQLGLGVGVHTGELVVGAIGAPQRLDYTVIGDSVNVASRIEGLTRKYDVDILISDATQALLSDDLPTKEIGTTTVKNRTKPVTLWTPIM